MINVGDVGIFCGGIVEVTKIEGYIIFIKDVTGEELICRRKDIEKIGGKPKITDYNFSKKTNKI